MSKSCSNCKYLRLEDPGDVASFVAGWCEAPYPEWITLSEDRPEGEIWKREAAAKAQWCRLYQKRKEAEQ